MLVSSVFSKNVPMNGFRKQEPNRLLVSEDAPCEEFAVISLASASIHSHITM